MELVGETYIGIGVINYNQNPKTYIEFPYTFNKVINDTYKQTLDRFETSFTSTYDAYGTLILEFGTYHNVVRQKITESGVTDYIWFNVSAFFPIIRTALADGMMGVMKHTGTLAGCQFDTIQPFTVFPNPTSDAFQVELKDFEGAEIAVCDAIGKLVATQKASDSMPKIDISSCASGIYMVKVMSKDGHQSVHKIAKK